VVLVLVTRLSGSRFGLALRSLREDERAAAAFGRNIYAMKLKAYVIGAGIGGLGGALFAGYLSAFNPSAWSPVETIVLYAAILVGGRGSNRGVILGVAVMVMGLQEATRYLPEIANQPSFAPAFRLILTGIVLVLFIRFRPQGLLPEHRMRDKDPADTGGTSVATGSAVAGATLDTGAA
jgi:ABC-type branched-subunit amino acid transport system permease subunit